MSNAKKTFEAIMDYFDEAKKIIRTHVKFILYYETYNNKNLSKTVYFDNEQERDTAAVELGKLRHITKIKKVTI